MYRRYLYTIITIKILGGEIMTEYPYVLVKDKLKKFLEEHIPRASVPDKIDRKYLTAVGFKSSNDLSITPILKFINFLDASGVPTDEYIQFRTKAGLTMAKSLRNAYKDLFDIYPDAYRKDAEALKNYFRAHTTAGDQVVNKTVATFKVLCEFADFEAITEEITVSPKGELNSEVPVSKQVSPATSGGLTVNINIQLQLPATDDASVYENLFSALKKHLLS
jgi:hypothetical protein